MSLIHISFKAYDELKNALIEEGHELDIIGKYDGKTDQTARGSCLPKPLFASKSPVSEPVSAHPDIFMCKMGTLPESPVFSGSNDKLGPVYPQDVLYNAVVTERFLICNTKTVSSELVDTARRSFPEIITIHVPQGYTKCNMVVVDDSHFITEDKGIYKAIKEYNAAAGENGHIRAECLLISPGHVKLPGYDRGFIGGASGRINNDIWFNGDLKTHPDHELINDFIKECGIGIRYLSGLPLVDIGSIIEEC